MTTLFNEQNRIARVLLYLLMLLPIAVCPQLSFAFGSETDPGIYCSESTTWNGLTWSNGSPQFGKDAIIGADYTFSGDTFNACSITVLAGVHVNFTQNTNVIITHNIHVTATAEVIFESGSNLIQNEGEANTGKIIIKRNSSYLKKDDYTLWSSPVSGQLLLDFSPLTLLNRFYTFNTTDNVYNTITAPATTTFQTAKGYLIRTEENQPLTPTVWEGRFEGTPNTGNVNFPLTYINDNKSYNSVGNPYPSPISIKKFLEANSSSITGTIWLWRKTDDPAKSSYATVTKLGYQANAPFDPETTTIQDPFSLHEEGIINTGQGFIVKSTCNQNLVFNNAMRLPVSTQSFFKTDETDSAPAISRYWLDVTAENVFTQALVGYTQEATTGYDNGLDGETILDGKTTLYTIAADKKLAIHARPEFEDTDEVTLGFKTETAGTFTFSIDHTDGLFAQGQHIYLVDIFNNSINDITEEGYTFTSESGIFENRFKVVYKENTAGIDAPQAISTVIFSNNHQVKIQSAEDISTVMVYDLMGRLIFSEDNMNVNEFSGKTINATAAVIVKATLTNGSVITKKILIQ